MPSFGSVSIIKRVAPRLRLGAPSHIRVFGPRTRSGLRNGGADDPGRGRAEYPIRALVVGEHLADLPLKLRPDLLGLVAGQPDQLRGRAECHVQGATEIYIVALHDALTTAPHGG